MTAERILDTALCLFNFPRVVGIEIRNDRLTRLVDQLLCGIGGIAAGIDWVPNYNLDLSRLHDEASLW